MSGSIWLLLAAGLATFLTGVNAAFLMHLHSRLTPWFSFKIAAVTLMCIYIALSMSLGNPATWRAAIGLSSLVIDVIAIAWMWASITRLMKGGITGFIPIGRLEVRVDGIDHTYDIHEQPDE